MGSITLIPGYVKEAPALQIPKSQVDWNLLAVPMPRLWDVWGLWLKSLVAKDRRPGSWGPGDLSLWSYFTKNLDSKFLGPE